MEKRRPEGLRSVVAAVALLAPPCGHADAMIAAALADATQPFPRTAAASAEGLERTSPVVMPLTHGMRITTANTVASVEFRVRSDGPGYCPIRVWSSYGRETVLPAPPIWSPWLLLFSHAGSVTATIGVDVSCSRGTALELRYFPAGG